MRPLRPSDPTGIGPYRLLAELGNGTPGRLWLAVGPGRRPVALRAVHPRLVEHDAARARWQREVDAACRASDRRLAAVLDADLDAAVPWVASAYAPGVPLDTAVDTLGPLPEDALLRLAGGLAAALGALHRVGVVHGGFRPSDVVLGDGGPTVTGFGPGPGPAGSERGDRELTELPRLVAVSAFLSPEQAEGGRVTYRSDVFALGAVLAFAALGRSPFAGSSAPQALYNILHREADLDGVPERLRPVVASCLAKDPVRRPTPDQVLESVGRIASAPRPWPASVHVLIARHTEQVDELVRAPRPAGHPPGAAPAPEPPRRPAPRSARYLAAAAGVLVVAAVWAQLPAPAGPPRPATASEGPAPAPVAPPVNLLGHTGYVTELAFSPDGRTLASASADGGVRLWNLAARAQVGDPLIAGDGLSVEAVAFSPDGRTLATGAADGTARLWDVTGHRELARWPAVRSGSTEAVAFSPDGRTLATGGDDGDTRLWDVATRQQIGQPFGRFDFMTVYGLAFTPDGRTLATAGSDGTARLWDVAGHQQLGQPIGDLIVVTDVAISPDGRTLVTGSWDHTTRLWDIDTHREIARLTASYPVDDVAFSPDGSAIAATDAQAVRRWDAATHQPRGELLSGTVTGPHCLAFSPDGRTVAIGSGDNDGAVQVWDVDAFR